MPYETISKVEAAERQLRVAIRLFFEDRDLVAIHTLAAAAQGVLYDLGKKRGIMSIFKDNPLIRPERKKDMAELFSEAQNFFKHADRDSDEILKFYYETTKYYLFDAANLYIQLTGKTTSEIAALQAWFVAKFPNLFIDDVRVAGMSKEQILERIGKVDPDDHRTFLDLIERSR